MTWARDIGSRKQSVQLWRLDVAGGRLNIKQRAHVGDFQSCGIRIKGLPVQGSVVVACLCGDSNSLVVRHVGLARVGRECFAVQSRCFTLAQPTASLWFPVRFR